MTNWKTLKEKFPRLPHHNWSVSDEELSITIIEIGDDGFCGYHSGGPFITVYMYNGDELKEMTQEF